MTAFDPDSPSYEIWASYPGKDAYTRASPSVLSGVDAASIIAEMVTPVTDYVPTGLIVMKTEYIDGVRTVTVTIPHPS